MRVEDRLEFYNKLKVKGITDIQIFSLRYLSGMECNPHFFNISFTNYIIFLIY